MQELETCENCHREFPSTKIHSHFSYCVRNIKKCAQCNEMVDMNHLQQHLDEFHAKLPCNFCKKEFDQKLLDIHKNDCELRTVVCEFCQQSVPIKHFDQHQEACGARTSPCPVCQKPIVLKNLYEHAATCQGKPPVVVNSGNSYQDYINRERQKLGMQPRVISTKVTVRAEQPSSVRVLPIQRVTIKPLQKSEQPQVIRHETKQILTRAASYKVQTPSQSTYTYISKPSETRVSYVPLQPSQTRVTYVTRQPIQTKITYVTKEPIITRKISQVKTEEGIKVYGGIESIRVPYNSYESYNVRSVGGSVIPGFEDQDEQLQRVLLESMMG